MEPKLLSNQQIAVPPTNQHAVKTVKPAQPSQNTRPPCADVCGDRAELGMKRASDTGACVYSRCVSAPRTHRHTKRLRHKIDSAFARVHMCV